MKWLAIINPHADHHTPEQLETVATDLRRLGANCIWTSRPKEAGALARTSEGYDGFIAVGGDGTISEIVNGLEGNVPLLGIVPAGTGNDLARDLGLTDEQAGVRALSRPRFANLDMISAHYRSRGAWKRYFLICTSGLGYVAGVADLAKGRLKRCEHARFAIAAFLQAWRQKEFTARLRFDDGPWQERTLTNLAVQNTRCVAQFSVFRKARINDGKLDVLLDRASSIGQLLEDLSILTGTSRFIRSERRQARKLQIELRRPEILMLDGDLVVSDVDAVNYEILPGRLRCCTGVAGSSSQARHANLSQAFLRSS